MNTVLPVVIVLTLVAIAVLYALTRFDRGRSNALLRLDWFVPMLRRSKSADSPSHSIPGRVLRRLVPASWQSNRSTKQRGRFRKALRWLGITWLASPVRRIVQSICLLSFLVLFLYVCWPYDSRPATPGEVSAGWAINDIDQNTGAVLLVSDKPNSDNANSDNAAKQTGLPTWLQPSDTGVFLFGSDSQPIGRFTIVDGSTDGVRLAPIGAVTPEMLDAMLSPLADFAIHEKDSTAWPSHYADNLSRKEIIPAETFLIIDPLVSLSTAIASRSWVWSLVCAAAILVACLLIPRGFCGYLCPLGTTIDLFDWAIAGRTKRFRVPDDGWWVHIKYYLLAGTLIAAVCGVLVSGFFSAIPVITRAMLFAVDPLQTGLTRGWHLIPAMNWGHVFSLVLFAAVLCLGFLRPRFWCKYVCPSGAVFSLGNLFRATERKVESSCINCNKCVEICPFDAIKPDFTTRTTDCTMCQTCGGVCPTHAIKFVERGNLVQLKIAGSPPTNETPLGRRGFLSLAAGSTAAAVGGVGVAGLTRGFGADLDSPDALHLVRPPGSVPEREFLDMCIRCGECFKACPNNVLQAEGFEQGLEGLWAPMVNADWAGCESSCNACGQVCPTGAIRALPIEEKRVARMGLAEVNENTCLPMAGREACDLCVQECNAAGYHAIEYTQVGIELDANGQPVEGTGFLAPLVMPDLCVGCGLCQTRCVAINVKDKGLLSESAIVVAAGPGKEDRLMTGSYLQLRQLESPNDKATNQAEEREPIEREIVSEEDPFGLDPF
ncbi:4Fe-4S binding protein [Stieleria varia]|uniref:Putative electron transport protein YccM n=1 Tax=Stieleria varia TaxID=2528005 RepID=A0A5C6ARI4_9BACT|nr:4Fe-4S binding protein [Stieleria varia]TWU02653.1 putative electron transport protein YccM [Stieleria varia]